MSAAGGVHRAVESAGAIGFEAVQLFTKNNNRWDAPPLAEAQVASFRAALSSAGIADAVAHNSYLINLASPDEALWERSIGAMGVELERAEALGIGDLVCHPGAHVGSGEEAGLARIVAAIDELHRRHPGLEVRIDLETTAGQGTCLGHRFEHIGWILDRVAEPGRLGVCVDTCHVFAAGHDFASGDGYNRLIEAIDRTIGLGRIRVWHLNDSLRPCGSRVDRHAHIGRGHIGLEAIGRVVRDPRFAGLPMILETPKGTEGGIELDTLNLSALRRLVDAAPTGPGRRARRATEHVRDEPRRG